MPFGLQLTTEQFLAHIWPRQGFRAVGWGTSSDIRDWRWFKPGEEAAAAKLAALRDRQGHDVFHACAAFAQKKRVKESASFMRALWADIDVGPDKSYPTFEAALAAFTAFRKKVQLPPALLVKSGKGLHVYLVLDADLPAAEWLPLARAWKALMDANGLLADKGCTADSARILRPAGMHNRKYVPDGEAALPVLVVNDKLPPVTSVETLRAILRPAPRAADVGVNDEFALTRDFPDSSAYRIADACAQIDAVRVAKGDVGYELWLYTIGVLKHTVEGKEAGAKVIHEWSRGHPEYDAGATDAKIASIAGPHRCVKFEEVNPAGCKGCPHKGQVASPIQLGVLEQQVAIALPDATSGIRNLVVTLPKTLVQDFMLNADQGRVLYRRPKKDGEEEDAAWASLCSPMIWPDGYYFSPEGFVLTMKAYEAVKGIRAFDFPARSAVGNKLIESLAGHGIGVEPAVRRYMDVYMSRWLQEIRQRADEVNVSETFGWQEDGSFLLGTQRFKPDGTVGVGTPTPKAEDAARGLTTHGSLDKWVEAIDTAYNYPGQEQYQFVVVSGFASVLMGLMQRDNNLVVALISPESGCGKTTALAAMLSIYGNPTDLMLSRQGTTLNAMYQTCAHMHSLPLVVDELTTTSPKEDSSMLYTLSDGVPKGRLKQNGQFQERLPRWATCAFVSSNKSVIDGLLSFKPNADAEWRRCLEVRFRHTSKLSRTIFTGVVRDIHANYGVAGQPYLQYVASNRGKLASGLSALAAKIDADYSFKTSERFVLTFLAAFQLAGKIAKSLGLIRFDIDALFQWVVAEYQGKMRTMTADLASLEDMFGEMLRAASPQSLITRDDGMLGIADQTNILHKPHGDIVMRVIYEHRAQPGMAAHPAVHVSVDFIRKWCQDRQVDFSGLREWGLRQRKVKSVVARFDLGRGHFPQAPVACWELDPVAVLGQMTPPTSSVTPLKAVK